MILAGSGNNVFQLAASLTLPVTITAGAGTNAVSFGNENAVIVLGARNDEIQGGNGNDTITAADLPGQSVSVRLGNGNHTIPGSATATITSSWKTAEASWSVATATTSFGWARATTSSGSASGNSLVSAARGTHIITAGTAG